MFFFRKNTKGENTLLDMKEQNVSSYKIITKSGKIGMGLEFDSNTNTCNVYKITKDAQPSIKENVKVGDILIKWNEKEITTRLFNKLIINPKILLKKKNTLIFMHNCNDYEEETFFHKYNETYKDTQANENNKNGTLPILF